MKLLLYTLRGAPRAMWQKGGGAVQGKQQINRVVGREGERLPPQSAPANQSCHVTIDSCPAPPPAGPLHAPAPFL